MLSADIEWGLLKKNIDQSSIGKHAKIYPPIHLNQSYISDYSYVSMNAYISMTTIGKFCSIGPNLVCGWGIHPTNGISTSPMFYSTREQNGTTLSKVDKIEERKKITIGNDVFIGANVTILDGVTIGDGAVIGAGAVVSKDIPPYAIAVGCPIEIKRYRLPTEQIDALQKIRWLDFDEKKLKDVERYFFDVEKFIHDTSKQPL
ncbi:MAG: CatB-related O-acetyltransferase [Bacteroidales bacterium]|nr:CatB-related O-acetyltransferase [Bacteroidales bacterium]